MDIKLIKIQESLKVINIKLNKYLADKLCKFYHYKNMLCLGYEDGLVLVWSQTVIIIFFIINQINL